MNINEGTREQPPREQPPRKNIIPQNKFKENPTMNIV